MATQNDWRNICEAASSLPEFSIANITNYFITRVACDGKSANGFKNLNSHAYPLFKAGHIQSMKVRSTELSHNIKCICIPEMKTKTYNIELQLDKKGDIHEATCECPAGTGPLGSCKHIAALCYALEEFTRIKQIRSPESCTSRLQQWNQPRKRKLDPSSIDDIEFVKYEYGKQKRAQQSMVYDPRPDHLRCTSDEEISTHRAKLAATRNNIALLHLLPCVHPQPTISESSLLPTSPVVSCLSVCKELSLQQHPISLQCLTLFCEKFLTTLKYSSEQVDQLERTTTPQRLCKRWHEERKFRLTASKFGTVIKRQRNHSNLAKQLLYSETRYGAVAALVWGREHESDALESFQNSLGDDLEVDNAGIFVSGFLGASPDGLVRDSSGHVVALVEVKCPYKARMKPIEEMYSDHSFCCKLVDGKPELKKNHDYYYQVQGQMAVTGVHHCYFFIWSPLSFVRIELDFDKTFWENHCYPALKKFYYNIMLPEIVYSNHPNLPFDYSHLSLFS